MAVYEIPEDWVAMSDEDKDAWVDALLGDSDEIEFTFGEDGEMTVAVPNEFSAADEAAAEAFALTGEDGDSNEPEWADTDWWDAVRAEVDAMLAAAES